MRKNGFTLVELLGVIVIIALLSVLIVPKVINSTRDSKKSGYKISVNNLVKAFNSMAVDKKATLTPFSGCSYNFDSGLNTCTDLEFSGILPTSGKIRSDSDGNVSGFVEYDGNKFLVVNNNVLDDPDYVRVEYIESTGTQYIDSGVSYDEDNEYVIDCAVAVTSNLGRFSGWNGGGIIGIGSSTWAHGTGAVTGEFNIYQKSHINLEIESGLSSRTYMTVTQGDLTETIYRGHASLDEYATLDYPIFAYTHDQNGLSGYINMKLWDMTISVNGIVVRDFIPCYRANDDVVGLYDIVENRFYTNSGTGVFVIPE